MCEIKYNDGTKEKLPADSYKKSGDSTIFYLNECGKSMPIACIRDCEIKEFSFIAVKGD